MRIKYPTRWLSRCAATLAITLLLPSLAHAVAYIRGATPPWGESTNEAAMDAVFGAGGWDDLRMADGPAPFLPGSGHTFIFLEGSDGTALELDAYLIANRAAIEAFVSAGGHLLLNSAPNQGGNIDFGFGGVTLIDGDNPAAVVAANPIHPVFIGPYTPVVTAYTGSSFGHATVSGGGLSPIIIGAVGDPSAGLTVLGEKVFGSGLVLLGGMTTDNFHNPQPEAANLRANIIAHAATGAVAPPTVAAAPVPALSHGALVLMAGLIAFLALAGLRSRTAG